LLNQPTDLYVSLDGTVYVTDTGNKRVQIFKSTLDPQVGGYKAIIVAGSGPYEENRNTLWPATRICTNQSYRALLYQGFNKNLIYYLSAQSEDLDGDGQSDVNGEATNKNLEYAITTWAKDADNLLLYMTGHGGTGTFKITESETLRAEDLDNWLDSLQMMMEGRVIVLYDVCQSGSFIRHLQQSPDKERIIVTSSSDSQPAFFLADGTLSFSWFFWSQIYNGNSFYSSYVNAADSIRLTHDLMTQLDGNGDGRANEEPDKVAARKVSIGKGKLSAGTIPHIGDITPSGELEPGLSSHTIYAENVTDDGDIKRVWAVIIEPGYTIGTSDDPILELPTLNLKRVGTSNRYEAVYNGFITPGTYNISVYAEDQENMIADPETTAITVPGSDPEPEPVPGPGPKDNTDSGGGGGGGCFIEIISHY